MKAYGCVYTERIERAGDKLSLVKYKGNAHSEYTRRERQRVRASFESDKRPNIKFYNLKLHASEGQTVTALLVCSYYCH